jgi:hypothetical protein
MPTFLSIFFKLNPRDLRRNSVPMPSSLNQVTLKWILVTEAAAKVRIGKVAKNLLSIRQCRSILKRVSDIAIKRGEGAKFHYLVDVVCCCWVGLSSLSLWSLFLVPLFPPGNCAINFALDYFVSPFRCVSLLPYSSAPVILWFTLPHKQSEEEKIHHSFDKGDTAWKRETLEHTTLLSGQDRRAWNTPPIFLTSCAGSEREREKEKEWCYPTS